MPIAATDLLAYNALNRPEDETATGGGGRDPDHRPGFTQLAANDDLEYVSDNAGDTTQTVTVDGRDAAGAFVTEAITLNGTTAVLGTQVFERVLSIVMSADAAGTVTIRRQPGGANVYQIPIGERGCSAMFIQAASSGVVETRYDKMFWLNNHGSLTLNAAKVQITADPAAVIRQGVEPSAKDDTLAIANRTTAPSGVTFVADNVQQNCVGTTLEAGVAQVRDLATGEQVEKGLDEVGGAVDEALNRP
jgi:hypothetical protein